MFFQSPDFVVCGESSALGANGRIARRNFFPVAKRRFFCSARDCADLTIAVIYSSFT